MGASSAVDISLKYVIFENAAGTWSQLSVASDEVAFVCSTRLHA